MPGKLPSLIASFIGGVLLTLAAVTAIGYGIIVTGSIDPGADQPIPPEERWAAKTSIRAYLKSHTPSTRNPLEVTTENLHSGINLYINNCAVCHGLADNKKSKIAEGFYKNAPLFAKEDWSQDADGLVYWFIEHGVRLTAMPAYNKSLNDKEKWQIVMFIKEKDKMPAEAKQYWQSFKTLDAAK